MNLILAMAIAVGVSAFSFTVFRDLSLGVLFNLDAFIIVVGGTMVALFIGFPFKRIKETLDVVISTFKPQTERDSAVRNIVELAGQYGKVSIRSIEEKINNIDDDFLRRGTNLLINRNSNDTIRHILEREIILKVINYNFSQNLLKTAARLTPSFGLAGTVISLIRMFNNFQSIEDIAPLMAVALMSTLYGVIISNLFILPLSAKVKEQAIMSESVMNLTVEGIIAINNMVHPLKIEELLGGYEKDDHGTAAEVKPAFAFAKGGGAY